MTLALFSVGKTARIVHGDALAVLRAIPDNSVDSVVTDPPSAIGFMGHEWDKDRGGRTQWVAWLASIMSGCLRVLKPGGHAFVWALPKKSHWTALAVEDAGFDIRDVHHHIFGSGFPKSHNVAKAIGGDNDKAWEGWGTALKPAVEHWILGRKPLDGTVAANVAAHRTGALHIEACRVEGAPDSPGSTPPTANGNRQTHGAMVRSEYVVPDGRWPAHLSFDEYSAKLLDQQSGTTTSGGGMVRTTALGRMNDDGWKPTAQVIDRPTDTGGASRFFYVAKASPSDKTDDGLVDNDHPTVKSTVLMRWLARLVTPPGGTVLDCFAGSGTTGVACALEGFSFIGVEEDEKSFETARRRIERRYGTVETRIA